jgi:iron(II)-dependent oxidoreductase
MSPTATKKKKRAIAPPLWERLANFELRRLDCRGVRSNFGVFRLIPLAAVLMSGCLEIPNTGEAGEACFRDQLCWQGYVCDRQTNRCVEATETDAGVAEDQGGAARDDGVPDAGSTDTSIAIGCEPSPTGIGGDMCGVPAGAFMMGCNSDVDTECEQTERPYHSVAVPAFRIDQYEVTTSQYKECVTADVCEDEGTSGTACNYGFPERGIHPMNCVSWYQAKAYCDWARKRLPTEAEWEKAARGADGRKYPWGDDPFDCARARADWLNCGNSSTGSVGSMPGGSSACGAEDMAGNVWEWVEDIWHYNYEGAPADGSAWLADGSQRVHRGGSWKTPSSFLRTSSRGADPPTGPDRNNESGFRCAWSPP